MGAVAIGSENCPTWKTFLDDTASLRETLRSLYCKSCYGAAYGKLSEMLGRLKKYPLAPFAFDS